LDIKECIDYTPASKIGVLLMAYLGFVGYYAFTGFTAPPRILTATESLPVRFLSPNSTNITIDLRLTNLADALRFFDLSCAILRGTNSLGLERIPVNFTLTHRLKKRQDFSVIYASKSASAAFLFSADSNISAPISILPLQLNNDDTAIVSVSFDFGHIAPLNLSLFGFTFSYPYVNRSCDRYFAMMRYFFSGVVLYGIVMYIISWENVLQQDQSCILLGLVGLISCNPTGFWLRGYPRITTIVDAIVTSVFINNFRFFIFERIRAVVNQKPSPVLALFFWSLGAADLWCLLGPDWALLRAGGGSAVPPFSPALLCQTALTIAYAALVWRQCARVCCREHELPNEGNRTFCFGVVQFVALFASALQIGGGWVTRIGATAGPKLFALAAHFGGAAACLIWVKQFQDVVSEHEAPPQFFLDDSDSASTRE
jgi:hypothetical protein